MWLLESARLTLREVFNCERCLQPLTAAVTRSLFIIMVF